MSAPAPPRQHTLGSSLLDQVLAETLDPAYAQAAARRREAAERGDAAPAAPPGRLAARLAPHRGRLLVAVPLLVFGLLGAVTYREAAEGAHGREQVREALAAEIQQESTTTDRLTGQLTRLDQQVTQQRDAALTASAEGQRALRELAAAEQAAALTAVSGPGIEVVVGNAAPAADSDPVGGSDAVALAGVVQDGDLQQVVNALWASGAEAVSINGQRIGTTTTIRQAGSAILVDFRPLSSPYHIKAIGDQEQLYNRFLSSDGAAWVAGLSTSYGIQFTFGRDKELTLPAGTAPELRSAQPLTPSTGGTATPAPATPATTEPGG